MNYKEALKIIDKKLETASEVEAFEVIKNHNKGKVIKYLTVKDVIEELLKYDENLSFSIYYEKTDDFSYATEIYLDHSGTIVTVK